MSVVFVVVGCRGACKEFDTLRVWWGCKGFLAVLVQMQCLA